MTAAADCPQCVIDRLATAAETGRLRASFLDDLDDEPFSRFEEWAESLSTIAEAVTSTRDAIDEWNVAEDREERADAKERALEAIDALVNAWNSAPLDVSSLADWEPEDEEDE